MNKDKKGILEKCWGMRHLSVEECFSIISRDPELKFFLTSVGVWFLVRWSIVILIAGHFIYSFGRLFKMVAG